MSFPRYPKYKASGVEWLGDVPEGWVICAPKRRIKSAAGGTLIKGTCSDEPSDGLFPGFSASGQNVWLEEYNYDCPAIVLSAVGARCGKAFKADGKWGVVANTHCLFPLRDSDRDYLWYLTNQEDWWEKGGSAQPFVKVSETLARPWVFPPLPEQTAIAEFLDRETGKIDELVAEQRRLMELLKEKRQAVTSHAVTKGLNPHAPMKPSGIEWLGDVPVGWTVRPLKTIASGTGTLFIDGDWIESKDISSAGIRYLTSGNVGEGFYKEQGQGFITDETFNELKCTEVLPGDLLISRLNVPIGRACIVPDLGSRIVTCVDNVVVRPASFFNRQFCVYLLSCKGHLENTEILGRGATMPRLSRSALGRLPFAFPPLPEQNAIVEFLDAELAKFDTLTAEAQRAIDLLQERRTALISAAVTGQIDVRQQPRN